jgi:hypothetical protein
MTAPQVIGQLANVVNPDPDPVESETFFGFSNPDPTFGKKFSL